MQEDREKLLKTLEHIQVYFSARADMAIGDGKIVLAGYMKAVKEAITLLKAQAPRVMTLEEVGALPYGHVLIETDKSGSLRWVDALMFCKNVNFSFDFITLEGRARLLGTTYNKEWRCWDKRPTDEQREATPWTAEGDTAEEP